MVTLEIAKKRLELYLKAEESVLMAQEYEIDGRKMKKADLPEIQQGIKYWQGKINSIQNTCKPRVRSVRI